MDYEIGTELLIQSPSNIWTPAVVEEDDGDEIFISYQEGAGANEWINKDSHRIKPKNEEWLNKLITTPSHSKNVIPEVKSMVVSTQPTEKEKEKEKEVTKKSTSSARSSSIFKVKFKKDDFLSKKTHDSKLKEQKTIKDSKKSSDRESKQLMLQNTSNNEKNSTNTSLKHTLVVKDIEMESGTSIDNLNSSKHSNETNLSRSENFEESLEDIEAEAEIYSPTKTPTHGDVKQKKKRKKYFGVKRRPEKKKKKSKSSTNGKKNVLVVKLNPQKLKMKENYTVPDNLCSTVDAETPPSKKMKPSLISNSIENSLNQPLSSFQQLAHNTLLQKIRMDASDEQGFRCPKQECRKLFRKENLLMMHIKHYHAEYTELLVSTPNVTDLATARIEGENVDELSPSYFLHRISQLEAKRSGGITSCNSPSPSTVSSPMQFNNQELESNTSLHSENYNSSLTSIDKPINTTQAYDSKDSGFSGIVESVGSILDTSIKETVPIKEPIKKLVLVDDFKSETHDVYDAMNVVGSDRLFKIKKKKTDIDSLPKEEVINCLCGSNQEDGLMIQCDVCLCWQHGFCNKIESEDEVPDNYVCTSCLNPSKKRRSKQYDYLQDWIKEGKVASVLQHKDERRRKDENVLKQSHQLVAEVIEHSNYLHSLLVKTVIYGQTPDHPKLYLWSEQGSKVNDNSLPNKLEELLSGPVPEKPINITDCRKNLLDEIDDGFNNVEARINLFEAKTNGLEDQVNGPIDNEVLSNTVTMLLRDLNSLRHYMSLENKNKETNDVEK